jgi:membrane protease YdiL (CAAX protease family)
VSGVEVTAGAVTLLGLVIAAVWGIAVRAGRDPLGARPEGPLPRVEGPFLLAFVAWLVAQLGMGLLAPRAGLSRFDVTILLQLAHTAIALALLPAVLRGAPRPTLSGVRLVAVGIGAGLATYAVVFVVGQGLHALYALAGSKPPEQDVVTAVRAASGLPVVGMLVSAAVLAPFAEEVFFRGALLPLFAGAMSRRAAVAVQAAVFGGIHVALLPPATWPLALPLALVGAVTGWLYLRTASLPVAFLVHACFNVLNLAFIRAG